MLKEQLMFEQSNMIAVQESAKGIVGWSQGNRRPEQSRTFPFMKKSMTAFDPNEHRFGQ